MVARRALAAAAVLVCVGLGACGSQPAPVTRPASAPPARTAGKVTIAELEARNRARHARRRRSAPSPSRPPAARRSASVRPLTAPHIVQTPIPFPPRRRAEMAAYAQRHYGVDTAELRHPQVIVEHYTGGTSFRSAYATFAPDTSDPELHELPGICAHFVIDRDGTIHQLVPLGLMCRHTVGLNYTAIGVEHVGVSDREVLSDAAQLRSSLALTNWLRCRYGIPLTGVIGHNESLGSPFHRERVARLRSQTHDDWSKPDMDVYRSRLPSRC